MDNLLFEIVESGAVQIYLEGAELPFLFQPSWPDGTAWKKGEAQAWAGQFILAANDETADLPGDGPDQPTKPRPVIEAEETEQDSE